MAAQVSEISVHEARRRNRSFRKKPGFSYRVISEIMSYPVGCKYLRVDVRRFPGELLRTSKTFVFQRAQPALIG